MGSIKDVTSCRRVSRHRQGEWVHELELAFTTSEHALKIAFAVMGKMSRLILKSYLHHDWCLLILNWFNPWLIYPVSAISSGNMFYIDTPVSQKMMLYFSVALWTFKVLSHKNANSLWKFHSSRGMTYYTSRRNLIVHSTLFSPRHKVHTLKLLVVFQQNILGSDNTLVCE